ncbi:MAG: glycosyltransferase, partial [Rhodocyclaceae bacterium]|nr:glycosyltransferase [Rhodocyclaceae bacterium]
IAEGVVEGEKICVLGEASICGVDGERFRPQPGRRTALRAEHVLPQEAVVFLYLGRLNRDKGVLDLADAFAAVEEPGAWLLIVGPDEEGLRGEMERRFGTAVERTRFVGYTDTPEDYMAAADVFCLPSYREGFGTVIIEAAAVGLPTIASRIYGVTDAVVDGETGLLHGAKNVSELRERLVLLARDQYLRMTLGHAARERALSVFSAERVTSAWSDYFSQLLDSGKSKNEVKNSSNL